MSRALGSGGMKGFSLIELMIVVVIVGVLAAVAGVSYRKYSNRSRNVEAMAMLGEFRAKEEAYKTEFNVYLSTATAETTLYPQLGTCASGQTEPCPKLLTTPPAEWGQLGINPQRRQLYCGYVAIAGLANAAPTGAGVPLLGSVAPGFPWYYLRAQCDNNATASANHTFVTASNTTTVTETNENK
jgi:type IV pilus assembly protein PilA